MKYKQWNRAASAPQARAAMEAAGLEGRELLRQNLPGTRDLSSLGEIRLSSRRVTVNPRKNTFAKELKPISFSF